VIAIDGEDACLGCLPRVDRVVGQTVVGVARRKDVPMVPILRAKWRARVRKNSIDNRFAPSTRWNGSAPLVRCVACEEIDRGSGPSRSLSSANLLA